jgi:ADP-heptose:LPS heptosyltransferase
VQYKDWQHVRHLLAVRLDDIGDVVMLGPALRTLKVALPKVQITLLASPEGAQVAPLLPWVDEVLVHEAVWQSRAAPEDVPIDVEAQVDVIEAIEGRQVDAAFIFTATGHSPYPAAYLAYLSGVGIRIGQSKEWGGGLLTHWIEPLPDKVHQVDRNLFLLEQSGLPVAGRQLELRVPESARTTARNLLRRLRVPQGEPFVVIAPGARRPTHRYPARRYAELCRHLNDRLGMPIVVVGDRADVPLGGEIVAGAPTGQVASIAGQTSVAELAAVIEQAELVITNNSASMHVADAFRRPTVVLFAGTELEAQYRPRGAPAKVLRQPTRCAPCHSATCRYNLECLDIPPAAVADEASGLLEVAAQQRQPTGLLTLPPSPPPSAGEIA